MRAAGCEVGLHGIKHDGKLFGSRAQFEAELPKIHDYLQRWDAVGFRSPATHRNAEWMHELACLYDSSFPDTDPFEPQPGGCCSILPFFFGDVVELPITLVQDHTLWEILRAQSIDLWAEKSEWIIANHGLINLITHPDYLDTPERLALYEEFLGFLAGQPDGWHALPRDVAGWWRVRDGLGCAAGQRRRREDRRRWRRRGDRRLGATARRRRGRGRAMTASTLGAQASATRGRADAGPRPDPDPERAGSGRPPRLE